MYKIISKYSKTGNLKYISHLDVLRFMQRAIKRAGIPANYSEGFNPHMKTSFGFPLSLGNESIGEYFDLEVKEKIDINIFLNKLNSVLPKEMQILTSSYTEVDESIMSRSKYVDYVINIEFNEFNELNVDKLNELLTEMVETGVIYTREKKNKKNKMVIKEINTKELIKYAKVSKSNENKATKATKATIEVEFITTETGSMKTEEFMKIILERGFFLDYYTVMKIDSLDKDNKPIM